jgi:hypothetical protein
MPLNLFFRAALFRGEQIENNSSDAAIVIVFMILQYR